MLALAFFISVFSTLVWLIFSAAYVGDHLNGVSFISLGIVDITIYLALILLPILILWLVFGFINQYQSARSMNSNLFSLFKQMKKNQDYTDLIARIMLEAEQEIKDGFILSKFDLFVSDMNELVADLLLRCNIATPEQIERLWTKVQNGGKWAFGKVLIEVNQNQPNFKMRIFEKSQQDNMIAGTVLEWCARYLSLITLLDKHDKERVFITIIETGVFGKIFSILAPVSDEIRRSREFAPTGPAAPSFAPHPTTSFNEEAAPAPAPTPISIPKPKPGFSRITEGEQEHFPDRADAKSFAARLNPFRKKEEYTYPNNAPSAVPAERDALSLALERSFGPEEEIATPRVSSPTFAESKTPDIRVNDAPDAFSPFSQSEEAEPSFGISLGTEHRMDGGMSALRIERDESRIPPIREELVIEHSEPVVEREEPVRFSNTTRTLNDLKKDWEEMRNSTQPAFSREEKPEPTFGREEEARKKTPETEEENFTYPFGGWTDEANYNK